MSRRKHRSKGHILQLAVALALACGMVACGDTGSEKLGQSKAPLYGNRDLYWPNAGTARIDINVCWENPNNAPGATAQARANWRDARREAVENAWGRFARINFNGWDGISPVSSPRSCASGEAGLHLYICNTNDPLCPALPFSQAMNLTTNLSGYTGLDGHDRGIRFNRTHGEQVYVHEIGHALGFYHEEEIPGATPPNPCTAQSPYPNSNEAFYGAYDPNSTMSYCSPPTTAPWLSPNDVAAIQRSYGRRITGSLVTPRGNCAAAASASGNGATAFVWDCDEYRNDQEFHDWPSGTEAKYLYMAGDTGTKCLAATSASSGANVSLQPCSSSGTWLLREINLRGFGGLCLDLQGGNTSVGTRIQTWECGALGGANQRWTVDNAGRIRYRQTQKCATVMGGQLYLYNCVQGWSQQRFSLVNGAIKLVSTGQCLDVQGPSDSQYTAGQGGPVNGASIYTRSCNSSMNQKWNISGALRYAPNSSLCLDRQSGDGNGSNIRLRSCDSSDAQRWDYYF